MTRGMIILICGGSGSGKTTLSQKFSDAVIVSTDNFYIGKTKMTPLPNGEFDFDDPSAVALHECFQVIQTLARNEETLIPDYDMVNSERIGWIRVSPAQSGIVIVEGIFALHEPLRQIGDLKIFIDTPLDQRVARRIRRDAERGRSEIEIIRHSLMVEEAYKKHIEPMKKHADLILGREGW